MLYNLKLFCIFVPRKSSQPWRGYNDDGRQATAAIRERGENPRQYPLL